MPDFMDPYRAMTPERRMTLAELTRTIRLALAAEHEAVHLYQAQADATEHPLARAVLLEIANEERVHAGQFQYLLGMLAPGENDWLEAGASEVEEMAAYLERSATSFWEAEQEEGAEAMVRGAVEAIGTLG